MFLARRLPAILTFVLLAAQVYLVWSGPSFPSQDGRAHAYTGHVLRQILFDSDAHYAEVYEVNRFPVPNWTTAAYFAAAGAALSPGRAEQGLATLTVLLLFASLWYLQTSLAGERTVPWPGLAALAHTWFLYMGFYNFLLGMTVAFFMMGYYARHRDTATPRHYVALAGLNLLAYFSHPVAQMTAMGATVAMAVQGLWAARGTVEGLVKWRAAAARLFVALAPGAALLLAYLSFEWIGMGNRLPARTLLLQIPHSVFQVMREPISWLSAVFVLALLLVFSVTVMAAFWRNHWNTPCGAVAAVGLMVAVAYFFAPEAGGGGSVIPQRMVWIVLCLVVVAAGSAAFTGRTRWPGILSLLIFLPAVASLTDVSTGLAAAQRLTGDVRAVAGGIGTNCELARLSYPAGNWKYPTETLRFLSTLHEPSGMAVERNCIDWTAYQPRENIFPVRFREGKGPMPSSLWAFENMNSQKLRRLNAFLEGPGAEVDYILVVGELPAAGSDRARGTIGRDLGAVLELLESQFELAASHGDPVALRLYRRK